MSELKEVVCPKCNKIAKRVTKGVCHNCYRRLLWNPPKFECKRCHRMRPIQGWGFCAGCYNSVFHIEKVKQYNKEKAHNISSEFYNELTSKCIICEFDKMVELHHLDHNHINNSRSNLVGLCPNHHRMIHHRDFCREVYSILKTKGFLTPEPYEEDSILKQNLSGTIHKNKLNPQS
ncbi:MAG: hypothetical protein Q7S74_03065 [Nanoarchaeota archaeon]|nr:hypothetical protein [Nanoarchaeota archaeon]